MNIFCIQQSWTWKTFFCCFAFFSPPPPNMWPHGRESPIMAPILSGVTTASSSLGCVVREIQSPSSSYMLERCFCITDSPHGEGWGKEAGWCERKLWMNSLEIPSVWVSTLSKRLEEWKHLSITYKTKDKARVLSVSQDYVIIMENLKKSLWFQPLRSRSWLFGEDS